MMVCWCCSPEMSQVIFWSSPLSSPCPMQQIIEREHFPALEMAAEWLKYLSKINTFKSPLSSISFICCHVWGWIKTDTALSWEHSVTWMSHPGSHSQKEGHELSGTSEMASARVCTKAWNHTGTVLLFTGWETSPCPGWERKDATPCCDYQRIYTAWAPSRSIA